MLAVIESVRPSAPSSSTGWRSTSSTRSATSSGPASSVEASSSTTNSSPPSRPTVSPLADDARRAALRRSRSSSSPAAWPKVSLTCLKPSMSTYSAADRACCARRARASICSARSSTSTRFGSPVSASWSAWWLSWPWVLSRSRWPGTGATDTRPASSDRDRSPGQSGKNGCRARTKISRPEADADREVRRQLARWRRPLDLLGRLDACCAGRRRRSARSRPSRSVSTGSPP